MASHYAAAAGWRLSAAGRRSAGRFRTWGGIQSGFPRGRPNACTPGTGELGGHKSSVGTGIYMADRTDSQAPDNVSRTLMLYTKAQETAARVAIVAPVGRCAPERLAASAPGRRCYRALIEGLLYNRD